MKPNDRPLPAFRHHDPLDKYVSSIRSLYPKLGRIAANQQALAERLARTAATLRSMGKARKQRQPLPR